MPSVECVDAGGRATPSRGRPIVIPGGYGSIPSSTGSTWRLHMHSDPPSALLDRVRKLLAKAEAGGGTPPEAEALTAKAAALMARNGIDRARLAASDPGTDRPGSRVIDIANPWAQVRAHLLAGLAGAMRCQCV